MFNEGYLFIVVLLDEDWSAISENARERCLFIVLQTLSVKLANTIPCDSAYLVSETNDSEQD